MLYTTKTYEISELEPLTQSTQNSLKEKLLSECDICKLCNKIIQKPVLDHQHLTKKETIGVNGAGLIRGVICNNCNQLLGKIESNSKRFLRENLPNFLRNAANYLEIDNLPYIHSSETKRLKTPFKKSEYNKAIRTLAKIQNKDPQELMKTYKFSKYLNTKMENLLQLAGIKIERTNNLQ